jgi:hypothetical protein
VIGIVVWLALLVTACGREVAQISGVVTSADTGLPLAGVAIRLGTNQTKTDGQGNYSLRIATRGTQQLYALLSGYQPYSNEIVVSPPSSTVVSFTLMIQPPIDGAEATGPEAHSDSEPDGLTAEKVPEQDVEPPSVKLETSRRAVGSSSASFTWRGTDNVSSPDALEYAYRLTPYQESWVDWAHMGSASYNSLLPGSYCFEVKARDEAGNACSPVVVSFSVAAETETPPAAAPRGVGAVFDLTRTTAARLLAGDPVEGKAWVGFAVNPHAAEAQIRAAFDTLKADGYINDYSLSDGFLGRIVDITSTTAKGGAYLTDLFGEEVSENYHGLYRDPFDHLVACDNLLVAAWSKASIEVTDIQRMGPWALVKYTWKRGEATPALRILQSVLLAEVLQHFPAGQAQEGAACFGLHDDGWRVESCL